VVYLELSKGPGVGCGCVKEEEEVRLSRNESFVGLWHRAC
jgi:hypothetical protein